MNLTDAIRSAISAGDGRLAGRIADKLRFELKLDYDGCYDVFKRSAPNPNHFARADFEALMADADDQENAS